MDQSLFQKYTKTIDIQKKEKSKVISILQEKSGIVFLEEEIILEGKKVSFQVSSVKQAQLKSKNIKAILTKEGYIVN